MGEITFFLGLQVKQKADEIFISQYKFIGEILKKFGFSSIRTASTPMETNKALTKDEDGEDVDVHLYRSMIGSLMYLTSSRPDIMFSVCACSRFQVQPKVSHLNAVKRIFRYLKGRPNLGLWYPKDSPFILEAFSDSDYAGASLDRKSTIGGCQFLGSRLISWQCKKQNVVANSTTEVEYIAASHCCGQVLWIQNQMLDYGYNFMQTKIHVDNESAICVVKNPVYHSKTKHIEIRHHFIRDSYEKRLIEMVKIHTDNNVADLLTKAFDVPRHHGGAPTQTRSERVLEQPIESPLSEGHTSGSKEGWMEHQFELTANVPITPNDSPLPGGLDLRKEKDAQCCERSQTKEKNGLDIKAERSRKQLKERKNRARKIRGFKKNKTGDAAKKKNQLLLLHDPLKGMSKDELGPQNELCGERRKDDLFDRVEVDEPDSMLQNQVLTKQVVDISGLHFGTGLGFIAYGLPTMRTYTPYGGIQILVVERPDCNSLNSYKFF
ncbi:hypothetical protein Tco_1153362 [Tanacetum coccineum]